MTSYVSLFSWVKLSAMKKSIKKYICALLGVLALSLFWLYARGVDERIMPSAYSSSKEAGRKKGINEVVLVKVVVEKPDNNPDFAFFDEEQLTAIILYSLNSEFASPDMLVRAVASDFPSDSYENPKEKREGGKLYIFLKVVFYPESRLSMEAFMRMDDGAMRRKKFVQLLSLPQEHSAKMKKVREVLDKVSTDIANAVNCTSGGRCRSGFRL